MINIVCDFNSPNSDLHTDFLFYIGDNHICLSDVTLSDKPKSGFKNILYITDIKSPLIDLLDGDYDIDVIQNNFYLCLDNNLSSKIINKIRKFENSTVIKHLGGNFYKKKLLHHDFTFYIREDSRLVFKFECFLKIISIFYDFNWSINEKIIGSIEVHVLTPAKSDIKGISITQLIMSYQKNQYPISHIDENVFDGLYIPYNFTLDSIESLLINITNGTFNLEVFRHKFNSHDFCNLFE